MKRKQKVFKRILACIVFFVMLATLIQPIRTEAAANDSYSSYTMKKTGVAVPKYKQRGSEYCAVAASACVEAISLGIKGDNNDAIYWGCWADTDGGKSMMYSGYDDVSKNAQAIYNKVSEGIPVLAYFVNGESKHWVVIVGYEGNVNSLDSNDFVIMNPYDGGAQIVSLRKFFADHPEFSWSRMTQAKARNAGKIESVSTKTVNGQTETIVKTKNSFRKLQADSITGTNARIVFDLDSAGSNHTCNGIGFAISKSKDMSGEFVYEDKFTEGRNVYPGQISFNLNDCGITLMPGESYYWQAVVLKENVTIRSQVKNLLTGEIVSQEEVDNPSTEPEVVVPTPPATNGIRVGDIVNFGSRYWDIYINSKVAAQLEERERGYHVIDGTLYYTRGKDDTSGYVKGFSTMPIRWKVVGEDSESWLLLQEFVVFGHSYSSDLDAGIVTYGNSEIRDYINSSNYLNMFFRSDEQNDILTTTVSYGTGTTNDKLFLPSFSELWSYFNKNERKAHYYNSYYYGKPDVTTPISGWSDDYAYDNNERTCAYWTRSSNFVRLGWSQPTYVNSYGSFSCGGRVFYTWSSGIRPMMRVKKNSSFLSKATTVLPSNAFDSDSLALLSSGSIEYGNYSFGISNELKDTKLPACIVYSDGRYSDQKIGIGNRIKPSVGEATLWVSVGGMTSDEQELSKMTVTVYPRKPVVNLNSYYSDSQPDNNAVSLVWAENEDDFIGAFNIEIARSTTKDGPYEVIYQGSADWVSGKGYSGYTDKDLADGQVYWYKVRGLYAVYDKSTKETKLFTEMNGIETTYSDPVYAGNNGNNNGGSYTPGPSGEITSVTMLRLYNPNSGEHFYTSSEREKNSLVKVGWTYEGVAWVGPSWSNTPVYRLYNENSGDHHYTPSSREKDSLVKVGWKYEGIGWYSDDNKTTPLYRLYNPNAATGSHHYTTSIRERDKLVAVGWQDEGIGWYAY